MIQLTRPDYRATLRPVVRCIVKVGLCLAFFAPLTLVALRGASRQAQLNRTRLNRLQSADFGVYGYAEGTAQPRTLTIEDGLGTGSGHELARFEPTGNMTVSGALHVSGNCGEWVLDANTRSGWSFLPKSGQCQ